MENIIEKGDKIWVSGEITINLGNYENIKIMNGSSYTLAPGEDEAEARSDLTEKIMNELFTIRDDMKRQLKRRRTK